MERIFIVFISIQSKASSNVINLENLLYLEDNSRVSLTYLLIINRYKNNNVYF